MTAILVVGAGAVGRRVARLLAETEGVSRVLVADSDAGRAGAVVEALGQVATAVDWAPADDLPDGVAAVACAAGDSVERSVAERALEARVPFAGSADDPDTVRSLLDLGDAAFESGVRLAVGCGLAPGLADVLARHAATALDQVSEIHVARAGAAGPLCAGRLDAAAHGMTLEWRDGSWSRERAGGGRRLVFFPEPVGSRDCRRVASGQVALLVDAFPGLRRASVRAASDAAGVSPSPVQLRHLTRRRPDPDGEWGAVWVEVRGRRASAEEIVVYGAVDRMAFAAAAVLAVAVAGLAGIGPGTMTGTPVGGAHGLATLAAPAPFLAELSRRGVQAASFEGS